MTRTASTRAAQALLSMYGQAASLADGEVLELEADLGGTVVQELF